MYSKMQSPLEKFDVIDLDPYGSAVPFLDAAINSISDGGKILISKI
jgi:tRNA (guanine26-N2/guanine27-N2)-dimethyltransferase